MPVGHLGQALEASGGMCGARGCSVPRCSGCDRGLVPGVPSGRHMAWLHAMTKVPDLPAFDSGAALQVVSVSPFLASGQRWSPNTAARHGKSSTVLQVRDVSPGFSSSLPSGTNWRERGSAGSEMCPAQCDHWCLLPPALTPLCLFLQKWGGSWSPLKQLTAGALALSCMSC